MKKIIALALCLMLVLCAAACAAETEEKAELGTLKVGEAFSIRSRIPEGYTFTLLTFTELNLIGQLDGGDGKPLVTVTIGYNEEYEGVERFNDVDEETVEKIKASFMEDDVEFEDLETAYGTRLLKVTAAGRSFADIYTIYKGYELEFVMVSGEDLQDADIQMLVDFISDMDFVPVE